MTVLATLPSTSIGLGQTSATPWIAVPSGAGQAIIVVDGSTWAMGAKVVISADISENGGSTWTRYGTAQCPQSGLIGGKCFVVGQAFLQSANANRKIRLFAAVTAGSAIVLAGNIVQVS